MKDCIVISFQFVTNRFEVVSVRLFDPGREVTALTELVPVV